MGAMGLGYSDHPNVPVACHACCTLLEHAVEMGAGCVAAMSAGSSRDLVFVPPLVVSPALLWL